MIAAGLATIVFAAFGAAGVAGQPGSAHKASASFPLHRTAHFSIRYDTDADLAHALGTDMEAAHDAVSRFCRHWGVDRGELTIPIQVVLFDRPEDYQRFRHEIGPQLEDAAGFYSPTAEVAAFFNLFHHPDVARITEAIAALETNLHDATDSLQARQARIRRLKVARDELVEAFRRLVIRHEIVHATLDALGVCGERQCCPDWLSEGLACLFEVDQPEVTNGRLRPNTQRLADLRVALREMASEDGSAASSTMPIPLSDLLRDFTATPQDDAELYAESWALVYYLLREQQNEFGRYLRAVAACSSEKSNGAAPSFAAAFGEPSVAWEEQWVAFVQRLPPQDPVPENLAPPADPR